MAKAVPDHVAQRLADAAPIFARDGVDGARITDIAAATGVPRATLYYYFEGKIDLLGFLICRWLEDIAERVRIAAARGSSFEKLDAIVTAQIEAMVSAPALTQVVMANLGRVGKLPEVAADLERALYEPIAEILADGQRAGDFCVADPVLVAVAIAGAVNLPVIHELAADRVPDAAAVSAQVMRLVRHGVARSPEASPGLGSGAAGFDRGVLEAEDLGEHPGDLLLGRGRNSAE